MDNLLYNSHFESGYDVVEAGLIHVPKDWQFDYKAPSYKKVDRQDQNWARPRVNYYSGPNRPHNQFPTDAFANGGPIVEIVANWWPTWSFLEQDVASPERVVPAGRDLVDLTLTATYLSNIWRGWEVGTDRVWRPDQEPIAGEVRLYAVQNFGSQWFGWRSDWQTGNFGKWQTTALPLTVYTGQFDLTVGIEFRARWGNEANGILVASMELK